MRYLLDTNILVRLVLIEDPNHLLVKTAVERLRAANHELCITPQSLRELWHVVTRSATANGAGLPAATAKSIVEELLRDFILLEDGPSIFPTWLSIVSENSITGAGCHDANHAASAKVHAVDLVLTFDLSDFNRFKSAGLTLVHPSSL